MAKRDRYSRGEFTYLVTIKPNDAAPDDWGATGEDLGTGVTRWAKKIYPKPATESVEGDVLQSSLEVVFVFDYVSTLRSNGVIVDRDGAEYDIIGAQELDRKRYHRCRCKIRGL
jgi:hypothetical protein